MINRENVSKVLRLWVDLQNTTDDVFTRDIIGESFKNNLSNIGLDIISNKLSDVIFNMNYNQLIDHINNLQLNEIDKLYILSKLDDLHKK
jgi:hypothetical protein